MSLAITHYKATLEKADINTLFYIGNDIYGETGAEIREKFDSFNVDFDHFQKYIQLIDVPNEIESIIIVEGLEKLKKVEEHFKSTASTFLVYENEEQFKIELENFEKERTYQKLEKHLEYIHHTEWNILTYYTLEKKEGFYFKSVGNFQKGMNDKFWDKFCTSTISNFALKDDFEYALSCTIDSKESRIDYREEFKKEFIDNFDFGASFMSISY